MKSAKDIFIHERELEATEGFEQMKKGKPFPEYKKYLDVNEEIERRMQEEMDSEPFANEIYEREEGL